MANTSLQRLFAPQPKDVPATDLSALDGAVGETITKMKLRARCETDSELARFLFKKRSAISQWKRRGAVPQSAKLRFLILLAREEQ